MREKNICISRNCNNPCYGKWCKSCWALRTRKDRRWKTVLREESK